MGASSLTGVHVQGAHARHLLNHAQAHEALHARRAHGAVVAAGRAQGGEVTDGKLNQKER